MRSKNAATQHVVPLERHLLRLLGPCMMALAMVIVMMSTLICNRHSKEHALIHERMVNARDKDGKTLMHAAAASGYYNHVDICSIPD
jgi:hypothetical protein